MSSYEYSDESQVKEENHSSDDDPSYSGNQTHEFQDDLKGSIYDANEQIPVSLQSSDSEYAPSDTAHISEAAESDQSVFDEQDSYDRSRSPRKKRALSSLKGDNDERRPLKRAKGTFNRAYLDLLNIDIQDAATQYISDDGRMTLPASQIGLIAWTSAEKEIFFESLSRLGRDNVLGIASRIRTKGVMEVRQYMKLLDDALVQRKHHALASLELADFPAAVEIGEECCDLLEDAADSLARRQENHEEAVERQKWGDDFLLTTENYEELEKDDGQEHHSSALSVFDLPMWLKLSETVFMNSGRDENNWQSISNEPPSIRLTALEDFYSLVVSVTTRLLDSASYIAESRIRSKRVLYPTRTRNLVKRKDMEAAIASLGLRSTRADFWGKCPRRLGLNVHEEKPHYKDTLTEPIPYDDVEQALGVKEDVFRAHHQWDGSSISSDSSISDATGGEDTAAADDKSTAWDSEDEEFRDEANEVLLHSAVDRPQTTREKEALISRIKAEREQEAYAEAVDVHATYKEEKRMWLLQGKEPSEPLRRPTIPETGRRSKASVGDVYSAGQDWRQNLQYVSEWEHDVDLCG
ncbi:putative dna-binding protein [Phaeoacremonium minimum UCRPA7]|uniref:Putative dna-binding protein n=1 Tax=Phaeoacremonium minimum (strain UCR-PA7) TaxID=1286976 RepID=R8BAV4_PHAM7|nr:putative dna-binding protein [Phaeoacremonium minimum UCRPA7]EON96411.1 putative dna-binding protein [Phaeoacremonium minimum UCRPA7]